MDSECKQSPLTLDADNPELGAEALTKLVREVLEEVFEARFKADDETLQPRRLEYNEVEQEFYFSDEHSDDCKATESVTLNVNPTNAQ
ncbi:hypothetical protein J1N35_008070 [Gossypium stocksii]|uniref:Uncharacterized protein n=1 Tax=Gossypium stocksii TaxID=47602 RepID=A0A9D3W8Q4_9ROSI|nr:hypothetical protein J1N35_008070 [Gossypium stocksii]